MLEFKKGAEQQLQTTKIKAIFICSYPDVCCCSCWNSAIGQEDHLMLFIERESISKNLVRDTLLKLTKKISVFRLAFSLKAYSLCEMNKICVHECM